MKSLFYSKSRDFIGDSGNSRKLMPSIMWARRGPAEPRKQQGEPQKHWRDGVGEGVGELQLSTPKRTHQQKPWLCQQTWPRTPSFGELGNEKENAENYLLPREVPGMLNLKMGFPEKGPKKHSKRTTKLFPTGVTHLEKSVADDQPLDLCSNPRPKSHRPLWAERMTLEIMWWLHLQEEKRLREVQCLPQCHTARAELILDHPHPHLLYFSLPFWDSLVSGAGKTKLCQGGFLKPKTGMKRQMSSSFGGSLMQ